MWDIGYSQENLMYPRVIRSRILSAQLGVGGETGNDIAELLPALASVMHWWPAGRDARDFGAGRGIPLRSSHQEIRRASN